MSRIQGISPFSNLALWGWDVENHSSRETPWRLSSWGVTIGRRVDTWCFSIVVWIRILRVRRKKTSFFLFHEILTADMDDDKAYSGIPTTMKTMGGFM